MTTKARAKPSKSANAPQNASSPSKATVVAAKKVSNPASTGGAGVTFENRVQAVRLLGLALGVVTPGIPNSGRIVELQFQAKRANGPNTDDLVCTVESDSGQRYRVLMQMKRGLTARPSDTAFSESVGNAWVDYSDPAFNRGADRVFIVHDSGSTHEMRGAHDVARSATTSLNAADWIVKLTATGSGNTAKRNALAAIRDIVVKYRGSSISDDEFLQFVKAISFVPHDLDSEGTAEHANYINLIQSAATAVGLPVNAQSVWARLVTACMRLNGESGAIGYSNMATVLDGDMVVWFDAYRNRVNPRFVAGSAAVPPAGSSQLPNMAGATWVASSTQLASSALAGDAVPVARSASADKFISSTLDHINSQIQAGKYTDATAALKQLGRDLGALDAHQKGRWYHMRAICRWHQDDEAGAAEDFLKAASLCDDDDRLAAARVRGLLLKSEFTEAAKAGVEASDRFPESLSLWLATANARLCNKETLTVDDIPAEHKQEADALQLVAWGYHIRGDSANARKLSLAALDLTTANFFTRDVALKLVLDDIASNPMNSAFRLLGDKDKADLTRVLNEFEPWFEKLWSRESISILTDTVYRLTFGYLVTGELRKALTLIAEAKTRGVGDINISRVEMEALIEDGKSEEALRLGELSLDSMPVDGLVAFAQLARSIGTLAAIEKALGALRTQHSAATPEINVVTAMRWDVMVVKEQVASVLMEVDAQEACIRESIPLLCTAARILRKANLESRAEAFVSRAQELLTQTTAPIERYMVASLLMAFRRFVEASRLYEQVLPPSGRSDIHKDLLYCYIRSDQRARAIALLSDFPSGWEHDEEIRLLAMELGQSAGDWGLLKSLVDAQLQQYPKLARSWLYSLMVAVNTHEADAAVIVEKLPDELEGPIPEQAQLANAEFEYGLPSRALRRLYSMVRCNMSSNEAASAMLAAHVWLGEKGVTLDQNPVAAAPGVTVTIEDDIGHNRTITIDPADCEGLPSAAGFCSATSAEGARLLGLKVGEVFDVNDGFGGVRHYTITGLTTAYQTMLQHAQQALRVALTSSTVTMLSLETDEEGIPKLDKLTAQLEYGATQAKNVFSLYGSNHFTLGVTARMLGKDIVTVVKNWPAGPHSLIVGAGLVEEQDKAEGLLVAHPNVFVIDAATLTELALCGCLSVLKILPKVYVSAKTKGLLQHCLDLSKASRTSGFASAVDGQLMFQEVTAEYMAEEVAFLTSICDAVEKDCNVVPAYGKEDVTDELLQVQKVVSEEEYSAILLALEYDATAISLDLRLRLMCQYCETRSVWPQALLMHLVATRKLSARDYSLGVGEMFLRNRNFISLQASDLLVMVYQGGAKLDYSIRRFIHEISERSTEFESAVRVTLNFLMLVGKFGTCQFGVVIELTERMLEGLFRHKDCPKDFSEQVVEYLEGPQNMRGWSPKLKPFFRLAVNSAKNAAKRPAQNEPIKARVLYCGRLPHLLSGIEKLGYPANIESVPVDVEPQAASDDAATVGSEQPAQLTPNDLAAS